MKSRLMRKLGTILFFCLAFAQIPLMLGARLIGNIPFAFAMLVAVVPVALLLSCVPGYVGGRKKHEVPVQKVEHRFETESEQRFLAEDAVKRMKPLRAPLCGLLAAGIVAFEVFVPLSALQEVFWAYRVIHGLVTAILLPLALNLLAEDEARFHTVMICGFVMYFAAGVYLVFEPDATLNRALYLLGLAFVVASGLKMNTQSLVSGAANRKTGRPARRILRRNRLLLVCVGVVGAIILYFDQLRVWTGDAAKQLAAWFWQAAVWLTNLFMGSGETGGGQAGGGGGDMLAGLERGEPGKFWLLTEKILVVVAFAAALFVLFWLGRKVYRLLAGVIRRLVDRMKQLNRNLGEDYEDVQESLDWGEVTRGMREDLKKRIRRLTAREKKWDAMDAREKVRYVVRSLYRRASKEQMDSLTIHEAAARLNCGSAQPEELARLYDMARYSDTMPTEAQAETLRRDVRL